MFFKVCVIFFIIPFVAAKLAPHVTSTNNDNIILLRLKFHSICQNVNKSSKILTITSCAYIEEGSATAPFETVCARDKTFKLPKARVTAVVVDYQFDTRNIAIAGPVSGDSEDIEVMMTSMMNTAANDNKAEGAIDVEDFQNVNKTNLIEFARSLTAQPFEAGPLSKYAPGLLERLEVAAGPVETWSFEQCHYDKSKTATNIIFRTTATHNNIFYWLEWMTQFQIFVTAKQYVVRACKIAVEHYVSTGTVVLALACVIVKASSCLVERQRAKKRKQNTFSAVKCSKRGRNANNLEPPTCNMKAVVQWKMGSDKFTPMWRHQSGLLTPRCEA